MLDTLAMLLFAVLGLGTLMLTGQGIRYIRQYRRPWHETLTIAFFVLATAISGCMLLVLAASLA